MVHLQGSTSFTKGHLMQLFKRVLQGWALITIMMALKYSLGFSSNKSFMSVLSYVKFAYNLCIAFKHKLYFCFNIVLDAYHIEVLPYTVID